MPRGVGGRLGEPGGTISPPPRHGGGRFGGPGGTIIHIPGSDHPGWYNQPPPTLLQTDPEPTGGTAHDAAPQQRTLTISSTVLEQVIPCVFGGNRPIAGMVGDYKIVGDMLYIQFVFSQGEQGGANSGFYRVWVNDVLFYENGTRQLDDEGSPLFPWISLTAPAPEFYPGSLTQVVSPTLSSVNVFGPTHTAYPGICYCVFGIDTTQISAEDAPSGLAVKAQLRGRICTDFRTGTPGISTNPMVIAHEVLTAEDCFLGLPAARLDATASSTWATIATWCDTVVGTTARYQYSGIVNSRDAWHVVDNIINHCFTQLFLSGDKYKAWAYKSQGETGIHLGLNPLDWVNPPDVTPSNENTIPDIVVVRYTTGDGEPTTAKFVVTPAPPADEFLMVEATCEGFWLAAQAIRWAEHHQRCVEGDRLTVTGEVRGLAAPLEPGDLVRVTTPCGTSNEIMRVHDKVDLRNGIFSVKLVEYTPSIEPTQDPVDSERPEQEQRVIAPPATPTGITLTWYRNRDRRTTNSDNASAWDQTDDKIVVTANVANSPLGAATADRLDDDSFEDQIQNVDAIVQDFPGSTFFQMVWAKSESTEYDLEFGSELTGGGYHGMGRIRSHWRLFRQISVKSQAPYSGPALKFAGGDPTIVVAAAIGWPDSKEDRTHNEWFEMTWTASPAAASCDRYELQYRTWDLATSTASAWKTHAWVPPGAYRIAWGDGPGIDAPHFPEHWTTGNGMTGSVLYDWRVVLIRKGKATELIPSTVQEIELGRTLTVYQSDDVDMAGIAEGDTLIWNASTNKLEPGDVTDFGADYLHGFESRSDNTLSFDKDTQILTIAPTGSAFAYWYKGTRVSCASIDVDLNDFMPPEETLTEGLWYVFFEDATGVPVASQDAWGIESDVPICTVFWNGTDGAVGDERHGYRRDIQWHSWAHMSVGARYQSGLAMTAPSTGSYSTIDFSAGTLWDEDIQHSITQQTNCRIFYLTAASTYTWEDSSRAHLWSGSAIQYIDTDTYAKTALTGAQRINTWIYGSNDIGYPLYVFVEARSAPHNTTALARAVNPPDLSALGLTPELKLLYRCIWGPTSLEEFTDYRNSASLPAGGTSPTAATNVTVNPTGNISATNVQTALEELDTEKQAAGSYLDLKASGTKTSFNLSGTVFDLVSWSTPSGQNHDGGKLHIEVGVIDATDDKAQALTSEWIWQVARKSTATSITVYQLGTPAMASPDVGTLTVTLNVATLGTIKVAVTSSLSSGSAPVGNLTWWMTGTGVATLTPA